MTNTKIQRITGTSLLLALMILFQSLRLFLPLPFFMTTFVIGSLVNCCLILACLRYGVLSAVLLAIAAPVIASLQGMLPTPLFILPVALGQLLYIGSFSYLKKSSTAVGLVVASLIKFVTLYFLFSYLLSAMKFSTLIANTILFSMGWPQIVTGIAGGILALFINDKIKKST